MTQEQKLIIAQQQLVQEQQYLQQLQYQADRNFDSYMEGYGNSKELSRASRIIEKESYKCQKHIQALQTKIRKIQIELYNKR